MNGECVTSRPKSQVEEEIQALSNSLKESNDLMRLLEERLSIVLTSEMPKMNDTSDMKEPVAPLVPMAMLIREKTNELNRSNRIISDILSRLEL